MMHQAVQNGRGQLLVVEDGVPFIEGQVGRDDHAALLIAVRDRLEQQLGTDSLEGDIAPLIKDQQIR